MQGTAGQKIAIPTTRVAVFRILGQNPGPMTGPGTNSYLIDGQKRCLIDPGPADETQLQCFLQALQGQNLDYILVTHTHRDHSPGAAALKRATGAQLVGMLPPAEASGQDQSFSPDLALAGGDSLDCGDYRIDFLHTPGHVSNHLCYLLREEKLLFTGDHVLQGTTPVILPPDGDMKDYLDSLQTLQGLDLAMLAPGHGKVMGQPQQEIAALIAHRLRREAKIVAALQDLGATAMDDLLLAVYDDVAEHLLPWARKTLLAHLLKLERDGRALRQQQNGQEIWQLHGN